jgi:dUTP pyrophosphatase
MSTAKLLFVKRLHPEAKMPARGNPYAAGVDIFLLEDSVVPAGSAAKLRTGIAAEIPEGYVGIVRSRSSAFARGLIVQGTIDCDYRGEWMVGVVNAGREDAVLKAGSSVCQVVVTAVKHIDVFEVDDLSETERGANGFGSTGNL